LQFAVLRRSARTDRQMGITLLLAVLRGVGAQAIAKQFARQFYWRQNPKL